MEVSGRQPGDQLKALRQLEESRIEVTRVNRERLRVARQILNDLSRARLADRQAARRAAEETAERSARVEDAADVEREQEVARSEAARDHVELSSAAEAAAAASDATAAAGVEDPARARRVAELKELHASGRLNTAERVERSAEGILTQP